MEEKLKAKAYDCLVQVQLWQGHLNQANQELEAFVKSKQVVPEKVAARRGRKPKAETETPAN